MSKVAAGGYDQFKKKIVFAKTYEEVEAADFHHSGIIPFQYMEKVESNEIIYFHVVSGRVKAFQFRWEEGVVGASVYRLDRYSEIEKEIEKQLKKR